ncbi:SurA, partial [Candidatus Pelagibacter sp.]|nr:SurA [Candidatus Pelagibacter sp.]
LYSLPVNSFTLINDENNNIYLAKTIKYKNKPNNMSDDNSQEYKNKYGSENKNTLLKTYDLFLNNKYDVVLNQKTIERVKNFFQ